jgi:predicted secreted hydrolase
MNSQIMKRTFPFLLMALFLVVWGFPSTAQSWKSYPHHQAGSLLTFPDDEGWHPGEIVEWWYANLHLTGAISGDEYTVMYSYFYYPTFVSDGFRILNLSNETDGIFYDETLPCNYTAISQTHLELEAAVFLGGMERLETKKDSAGMLMPFQYHLSANAANGGVDLDFDALKPPLMVGDSGYLIQGDGKYTYYYSQTNLAVSGNLTFDGFTEPVTGVAWMDRQYGQVNPSTGEQYEWFSLQLSNGMDMNIWNIFTPDNRVPDTSTYRICSVWVDDSTDYTTSHFDMERLKFDFTPDNLRCYARQWHFTDTANQVDLMMTTLNGDNEVQLPFRFYEGNMSVSGTIQGQPVTGIGFAELLHSYSHPDIDILMPSGGGNWDGSQPVVWQLQNPDDAMNVAYDLSLSLDNKASFNYLAQGITDTSWTWDISGIPFGASAWLRVAGYSADTTLFGMADTDLAFIVTDVDGIPDAALLSVFPNPTGRFLKVSLKNPLSGQADFRLLDALGREWVNRRLFVDHGEVLLDLSALPAGSYFLEVKTAEGIGVKKVVVRR